MNAAASGLLLVAAVVFCVAYHVLARWWRSPEGRHLMAGAAALGALGGYTVAIMVWPDAVPALRWVRAGLVLALAVLLAQRTVLLWRAQHHC
ncbi:hypothetical protein [Streptomyces sp. ST2-7A]|uniref:putative phage holin n=1 Tax=Streptomyces sp. ST2-7A TaxID=2907214 RepID=UPI001F359559|nr:hypothetical protein [Streptomyces sp. ST2-7A]MCE7081141.1 hypothetical protein [Streptomyces sp. ST2-7A]